MTDLPLGSTSTTVMWIGAVALLASGAVIAISRRRGTERGAVVDELVMVWFVAALVVVAILTLQPGPAGWDAALPAQLDPTSRVRVPDARANVLLYLPVGFFAVMHWRLKARPVVWATGLALSLSFAIELAQLVLPMSRSAETQDLVFNTFGGFAGGMLGILVVRLARRYEAGKSERTKSN